MSVPVVVDTRTFGFDPERNWRQIQKFRAMGKAQRESILGPDTEPIEQETK